VTCQQNPMTLLEGRKQTIRFHQTANLIK